MDYSAVHGRRRSVDVGGLALAFGNQGLGHGWGGWEERDNDGSWCVHLSYFSDRSN